MKIEFADCMDMLCHLLEGIDIKDDEIYVFANKNGKLINDGEAELTSLFDLDESISLAYCDEGYPTDIAWYKPDFSPDTLGSFFYIGNIFAVRGNNLNKITGDICIYELVLRLADIGRFYHLPKVLYINNSDETAGYLPGFEDMPFKKCEALHGHEMVSVIIPSKDNADVLKRCLESLKVKTQYTNYEIIVVDNGSCDLQKSCIAKLSKEYGFEYIYDVSEFNFSKMCNVGARSAKGNYLLFLNDDTEIIDGKWMYNMLLSAAKDHVGAVGAKLYYPNYHIQHVGITNMGIGPAHKKGDYHGHERANYNMLAVTGACLMIKRSLFEKMGGFDEQFPIAYNDVELCFKLYKAGYYNVVRNDISLIHHESVSRGMDENPDKKKRLISDKRRLYEKYPQMRANDPFYSPNLVQWKWDDEYNENIIHDYDKEITPVCLTSRELGRLPREHDNKYIRKITGENRLMFNIDGIDYIDSVENMYDKNMILVRGWVALREQDNSDNKCKKHLLLKSEQDEKKVYVFDICPKQRQDVKELLGENTLNASNTGINVFFDVKSLPKGNYLVGVLTENKRRYVKWSTEIIDIDY